ncbi:MAG: YbaN family protein [Clostridia bacterium]|nr:YbaN family protein [Clostridia bacterium]
MKIKKILWLALGLVGFGIGAVGAVLPMLPVFPFLLLATVGFAKSSERLHTWFVNTKLYRQNLESYVKGRGMTWATKLRVMITVTLLMSVGFIVMLSREIFIPCNILFCVWIFHILYFVFGVKKYTPTEESHVMTRKS